MLIRLRKDAEDGIVLVTVLLLTMIMLIVVAGTMAYAVGSQNISRRDQDWNAALSAAEAGLDDYLFRLNENDQYYLYNATTAPPDGNQAFNTWVSVPDSGATSVTCTASANSNIPCFRYKVDTTNLVAQGAIIITATGRSRGVTRTIQATLRRKAFIDYLYFTDYETKDPAAYDSGDDFTPAEAQTYCAMRYYEGRDIAGRVDFVGDTDGDSCTEISFATVDTVNGPLHSNDAIRICGDPTFNGNVTTSWNPATGNKWVNGGGSCGSGPVVQPCRRPQVRRPADDAAQQRGHQGGRGRRARRERLPVHRTDRDHAQLRRDDDRREPRDAVELELECRLGVELRRDQQAAASQRRDLRAERAVELERPELHGGVPHVDAARGHRDREPPARLPAEMGPHHVRLQERGRLPEGDAQGPPHDRGGQQHRRHRQRDVLDRDGRQRPARPDREQLRRDLPPDRRRRLGRILDRPGREQRRTATTTWTSRAPRTAFHNPTIQAALLSVAHSFRVQNYKYGEDNLGSITINGAIAQKYRGIVGTINTSGYGKNYNYDTRLKYQSPPHFLTPIAAAWQIVTWVEQKAACAYNATTTC